MSNIAWSFLVLSILGLMASASAQLEPACNQAKSWQPMAGSPPAEAARIDGKDAMRLLCNYAAKIDRASWDCPVNLDMSQCQGLRFEVRCTDPLPVSGFSIYLQSGGGWYASSFSPPPSDRWQTVEILKEQTRIEGRPAGWSHISTIRISAWRGGTQNTQFAIADMALTAPNAKIAIVRAETAGKEGAAELNSAGEYAEQMAGMLRSLHLPYSLVSDTDVTLPNLQRYQLVILPHNPQMPQPVAQAIAAYMDKGGKVLDFYGLPSEIAVAGGMQVVGHLAQKSPGQFARIAVDQTLLPGAPATVIQRSWNIIEVKPTNGAQVAAQWLDDAGKPTGQPAILESPRLIYMSHVMLQDDGEAKRKLLLAMIGKLLPEAWSDAAKTAVDELGRFNGYDSFAKAQQDLSTKPAADKDLAQAVQLREEAQSLTAAGKFIEAIDASESAKGSLILAFCSAQEPLAGEQRAFWCHNAAGVTGMTWDESIKRLADNGFNTIIPNMLWGGVAFYPSKVLPVAPLVSQKGDQIKQCLAACRKYGVKMHVWKVNWNMGWQTPKEFMAKMKAGARTQVSFDGTAEDRWLCPSHPANQQLEIDAMVEVATMYDVDGIHFDYIRYPGPDNCFCDGCRERFEKVRGHKLQNWPADARNDADTKAKWLDFRRDNITKVVASVAERVHRDRPAVKISAAVFTNWPVDRDGVGQDWKLWCEKGYLDFVCPMDYTQHNSQFASLVTNQKQWAGKVPVYPGIGLSTWPGASRDIVKLIEQIQITRDQKTNGFTIFEYNTAEASDIVPLCGTGITRGR